MQTGSWLMCQHGRIWWWSCVSSSSSNHIRNKQKHRIQTSCFTSEIFFSSVLHFQPVLHSGDSTPVNKTEIKATWSLTSPQNLDLIQHLSCCLLFCSQLIRPDLTLTSCLVFVLRWRVLDDGPEHSWPLPRHNALHHLRGLHHCTSLLWDVHLDNYQQAGVCDTDAGTCSTGTRDTGTRTHGAQMQSFIFFPA